MAISTKVQLSLAVLGSVQCVCDMDKMNLATNMKDKQDMAVSANVHPPLDDSGYFLCVE